MLTYEIEYWKLIAMQLQGVAVPKNMMLDDLKGQGHMWSKICQINTETAKAQTISSSLNISF